MMLTIDDYEVWVSKRLKSKLLHTFMTYIYDHTFGCILVETQLIRFGMKISNFETGFWSACLSNNIASYSDMNNIAEIIYLSEYIPSLIN